MEQDMEESGMNKVGYILGNRLPGIGIWALLSLSLMAQSVLPAGETVGRWVWFDYSAILAAVCISSGVLCYFRASKGGLHISTAVVYSLIFLGAVQAVWGLRQLYGFTSSNHPLYALTGSFFNPGPYSGYLAMTLPVCLYQWLLCRQKRRTLRQPRQDRWSREAIVREAGYAATSLAMLLVLCVLPAGMSRSAWLAAGISCLWVYGCYAGWGNRIRGQWRLHRRRTAVIAIGMSCLLLLAGGLLFALKPDSARGRLFMWKITCNAIAGKPWEGHGTGNFAAAYGDAQETYFAAGDYGPWEERVAGSPEYAFNEYLQAAVELGVPLALCLLAVVMACLHIGIRKRRYGVCGAVLSLMVFSFSSYPLQLPVFMVTFGGLLLACVSGSSRREWLALAVLAGSVGGLRLENDLKTEHACREWMNAKVLYNAGAYESAEKDYGRLYPLLKDRASFLFEYGHALHRQQKAKGSNRILKEALRRSNDPMILNVIGKNYWQAGDYLSAEEWFIRSTHRLPGRIYPYYLLAKLYAEQEFRQPDKFEKMKRIVLTKEPKVNSTAVRQMREEIKKLCNHKQGKYE